MKQSSPQFLGLHSPHTQEAWIRLVHTLLACAEVMQQENFSDAEVSVKQIPMMASSQGGAICKFAAYFGEVLARRMYRFRPPSDCSLLDAAFDDAFHAHFYESCPYLKFVDFTKNQAILEAFGGRRCVHQAVDAVPALLQALALRPGSPPSFQLTGIRTIQPDEVAMRGCV